MRRWLPAPLLSASLLVLWLVLNGSLAAGDLMLGAAIALVVPVLSAPLRPLPVGVRRPGVVLRLILRVAHDVVVSNVMVGRIVLRAGRRPPRSAFVTIPLELHDANGLAALAMITTAVPGTVWSELALDRNVLRLHVLDVDDEAAFVEQFKRRYERPLKEIFG